jgi:hypothetical protein
MTAKPPERTFLVGMGDIGASELKITAPTEKQARERAKEAWKQDPDNKPKIVYLIETTRAEGTHGH